ncbi:hypothetical protein CPC16_001178 [Podila verticillata]|nr:hypothetical protein CPC16_001178 [Podila verticillata]
MTRGVRPLLGTPPVPLMNQPYPPFKHDHSNRPPPGVGQISQHYRPQYQPSQSSSYTIPSQASNQQDQPGSSSFSNFTDIPTEYFNTANFGTVAIPPPGTGNTNTTGDTGTGTGPSNLSRSMISDPRFTVPGDDADMDRLGDLDLPPDFDDDLDIKDDSHSQGNMDFTTQDIPRERASTQQPSNIKSGSSMSNAALQAYEEELRLLKQQLAEREEQIKTKDRELMMKTGENSILKENCERAVKEVRTTVEQARQDKMHDAQERAKMREDYEKEIKNQSMSHQFDLFNMNKTKALVPFKASETPKQSLTQQPAVVTPEFPSMFSGNRVRAPSVKPSHRAGSSQSEKDAKLEKLSLRCSHILTELTFDVHKDTVEKALKNTTTLLQRSIALRKPLHTRSAVKIIRKLYATFDSVAEEVCTGLVAFLDDAPSDPLESILSEENLESTLACILYLLITRFAQCWPSAAAISSSGSRQSSSHTKVALVNVPPNSGMDSSWISLDAENSLSKEDHDLFEEDLFALIESVVQDQLRRKLSFKMIPLAHWRIFDNVLKLHAGNIRTLDRALTVLDVISKDTKCCRFLCGWSNQRGIWTDTFTQIETLASLLVLSSAHDSELANGGIPRMKLKAIDIMGRVMRIEVEQTRKIARETSVVYHVVRALREQVELCERIKTLRSLSKAFDGHNEAFRPQDDYEFKPSIMFDPWDPSTISMIPPSTRLSSDTTNYSSRDTSSQNFNFSYMATLKTTTSDKVRKTLTAPDTEHDYVILIRSLLDFMLNLLRQLPEHANWMKMNKFVDHTSLSMSVGSLAVKNLDLSPFAADMAGDLLAEIFPEDEQERALLDLLEEPKADGRDDDNW